nr:hypothetical protein [Tanacetum cinerariifolium]
MLDPPVTAALGDSSDSIDKLFDEDAGQEHSVENDDDVLAETVAKDSSKVVAKKAKKKQKRKVVGDASGSTFPPKKLREDYHARASRYRGKDDGPTDFMSGPNLRTCPLSLRSPAKDALVTTVPITTIVTAESFIVLPPRVRVVSKNLEIVVDSTSAGGVNAYVVGTSKLNEPIDSSDSFYASYDLDSDTLHRIYVRKRNVTNDFVLDDLYVCRDLTDPLASPTLFSQMRAMNYDKLYSEFNVRATWQ